jgi:hypothetical protein
MRSGRPGRGGTPALIAERRRTLEPEVADALRRRPDGDSPLPRPPSDRRLAAAEALASGRGGVSAVAQTTAWPAARSVAVWRSCPARRHRQRRPVGCGARVASTTRINATRSAGRRPMSSSRSATPLPSEPHQRSSARCSGSAEHALLRRDCRATVSSGRRTKGYSGVAPGSSP